MRGAGGGTPKGAGSTRIPVGRLAALAALVVALVVIAKAARAPHWREIASGVEFATLRGEPYCRSGSSAIGLLRLDPVRVRLAARSYLREPEQRPLGIGEWRRRSGAIAVFNAGQYYPDYHYMGLLVSDGDVVAGRLHPGFRGALVAEPGFGDSTVRPLARVLDLERDTLDPTHPGWREVAQSFMLFGRDGTPRVRQSDQIAGRTVVAEDAQGRIVVATSEGGYTLWDFARLLNGAGLGLVHAMNMDGGHEAQLLVDTPALRYASYARDPAASAEPVPLPAVITVTPR